MRPAKLLKQYEDILCRARDNGNRVFGASYKVKEALVHFGYAKNVGVNQSGYDNYILTEDGILKATELTASRQITVTENPEMLNIPEDIKTKVSIFDEIVEILTDQEIMTKTIKLPNGVKARFDRSGPTKIVVQINKIPENKSKI